MFTFLVSSDVPQIELNALNLDVSSFEAMSGSIDAIPQNTLDSETPAATTEETSCDDCSMFDGWYLEIDATNTTDGSNALVLNPPIPEPYPIQNSPGSDTPNLFPVGDTSTTTPLDSPQVIQADPATTPTNTTAEPTSPVVAQIPPDAIPKVSYRYVQIKAEKAATAAVVTQCLKANIRKASQGLPGDADGPHQNGIYTTTSGAFETALDINVDKIAERIRKDLKSNGYTSVETTKGVKVIWNIRDGDEETRDGTVTASVLFIVDVTAVNKNGKPITVTYTVAGATFGYKDEDFKTRQFKPFRDTPPAVDLRD